VTIATNHFGHFLLTNLLLPHLKRTAEAALANGTPVPRVVCISSKGHAGIPLFYKPVLDIDEKGDDLNVHLFVDCSSRLD
jgi:NAD(P)-dependent dehydrogenase (short-subunit alcohol dehydrogenase family)